MWLEEVIMGWTFEFMSKLEFHNRLQLLIIDDLKFQLTQIKTVMALTPRNGEIELDIEKYLFPLL